MIDVKLWRCGDMASVSSLSLALIIMTDGQSQTPKNSSNRMSNDTRKWFKKTFSRSHGRSLTSPQPSASGQENRGGEIPSVLSSGAQSIIPVIGAPAATSQQGVSYPSFSVQHVDHTPTHLLRSPSRGPSVSTVVQSE